MNISTVLLNLAALRYFNLSNHTTIAVLFISHIMTENQSCLMYLNMHITGKCNNEFVHRK